MLKFNPKRIMAMRGIDKVFNFLHKNGFGRSTAHHIANEAVFSIKIEHISKLCVLLNCTPNELFEWYPDTQTVLPENHALKALVKKHSKGKNLKELLMDVPAEKLPEIENLLEGLKDG